MAERGRDFADVVYRSGRRERKKPRFGARDRSGPSKRIVRFYEVALAYHGEPPRGDSRKSRRGHFGSDTRIARDQEQTGKRVFAKRVGIQLGNP
jgi:hypothetical protein